MVDPGDFFRPSRFMRWTLVPVLVVFALWVPFAEDEWSAGRAALVAALSGLALAYAAALLWPRRAAWAARATAAGVFLFYVAYLVDEWFLGDEPLRLVERQSQATPGNALKGRIVIGLPALFFALRRRGERAESSAPSQAEEHPLPDPRTRT